MRGLLYVAIAAGWLVALRREAARIRWLRMVDTWCKDLEDFAVRVFAGLDQAGMTADGASERMAAAAPVWAEVNTRVPASTTLPRMTSPGDAGPGMTLDELLGRVDDALEDAS